MSGQEPDGVQLVLYLADGPARDRRAAAHAERARLNATRAIGPRPEHRYTPTERPPGE
jgi:hypothetical protein